MNRPAGFFETVLLRHGNSIALPEHLLRMAASAQAFGVPPIDVGGVMLRALTAGARGPNPGRMKITHGPEGVRIAVSPFTGHPEALYAAGADATLAETPGHPLGEFAGHKVLPYDALAAARTVARRAGAIDIIFTDHDGAMLEGAASNLFLVTGGILRTPPLRRRILPGITRGRVILAAKKAGLRVAEEDLYVEEFEEAEEAFLTGSLMEVMPLRALGRHTFVPGPVARRVLEAVRA
jgi:branched-subunit amino acid aminotransferase/4-amino-4-deoxychorismate lyase